MELLERESHLAQLEERRWQAAAGHGQVVVVGGEAGVGKTSLVDAFARRVPETAVQRASCVTPSPHRVHSVPSATSPRRWVFK